ncbi:MAG: NAD(P)/FAD-dependent oxidoreductase [Deltaproteobacteria bacterium]|nr:NAD(P)/FAD-dependent oxidoreductase [Deltaproteobacteria bacterium]
MPKKPKEYDVVVVGAGTAGSACALFMAQSGYRVALIEKRPLTQAGAHWINGVPSWMFLQAGLTIPEPPEDHGTARTFVLTGKNEKDRLVISPSPIMSVNVELLVARLHKLARRAGVELFDRVFIKDLRLNSGRPVSLTTERRLKQGRPSQLTFKARLFVDASGLAGALRKLVPPLSRHCPAVGSQHLCSAAQEICAVKDRAGAAAFLEKHDLGPADNYSRIGVDGGFSTLTIMLGANLETVDLLTGGIADGNHLSGPELMQQLKEAQPWIGQRIFGGAGLVPLRRAYDRLVAPGLALVGDCACQVFSAHGSGTGAGLLAARALTEAVAGHDDPGHELSLLTYQANYQREFGAVCAACDVFRRYAQSLSCTDIESLLSSGIMSADIYRAGLDQAIPLPKMTDILIALRGIARVPRLAELVPLFARMSAIFALYRRFPRLKQPAQSYTRVLQQLAGKPAESE